MKLAVMQPYFLPYIGYFQLMAEVDKFVIFDDVNFINRGWINRNRILVNGKTFMMTIPIKNVSQNNKINEIEIVPGVLWRAKLLRTIEQSYKRAPYYEEVIPLVVSILDVHCSHLSTFVTQSIVCIKEWLGIECELVESSSIYANTRLKGEERILDICRKENATQYINLPGGRDLYVRDSFASQCIDLYFIKPLLLEYSQNTKEFIPWLSIIDLIMFNGKQVTTDMLMAVELQ